MSFYGNETRLISSIGPNKLVFLTKFPNRKITFSCIVRNGNCLSCETNKLQKLQFFLWKRRKKNCKPQTNSRTNV